MGIAGGIALIKDPPILLPTVTPDSEPVPGEPEREKAQNLGKFWRQAEGMLGKDGRTATSAETKGEIEAMRSLVNLKPEEAENWDRLGKSLYLAGQYDEAVKAFRKALEIKPGVAEVLANLGVTLKTKGEMTEYEKTVQSLALVDAKMARELMSFSSTPASGAVSSTTPAPARPPVASVGAPTNAGPVDGKQGSIQESGEIGATRKLVAMDPKDADSWDRLGKSLYLSGKYEEAVASFDKSLALKPNAQEVLANLGVTLKAKGDTSRYEKVLEKLATINPKTAAELKAFELPPKAKP